MNLNDVDSILKIYKGLPLENAEIKEIAELIIAGYKELIGDTGDVSGCSRCPKKK